ncbi:CHAT domain-containing protein [Streptomyces aidingensis]|uniref:CHAT domain-containing protein n=1 Tax=Streptomyces aidingensis TaxID=910347 RepID=A0A1I1R2H5_9ACTN|nr:CHAT domain-containing protein [Streptomyces aidingensis]SFD25733.1 CHAT domain-containing protein [Streptomyces aidingensis]
MAERAEEILARAGRLLPAEETGQVPTTRQELARLMPDVVRELSELEAALSPDDPSGPVLRARLGGLHALLSLTGPGTEENRAEGVRLLRAARAGLPPDTWEARRAAVALALLLVPMPPMTQDGKPPAFPELFAWAARNDFSSEPLQADMKEAGDIFAELSAVHLPGPLAVQVAQISSATAFFRQAAAARDYNGLFDMAGRILPDVVADPAQREQLGALLHVARTLPQPEPGTAASAEPPPGTGPAEQESEERVAAMVRLMVEMAVPGALGADGLAEHLRLLEAPRRHAPPGAGTAADDAFKAGLAHMVLALRTGDPERVVDAAERLRVAVAGLPPGDGTRQMVERMSPALQLLSGRSRGSREADERASRLLAELDPGPLTDPERFRQGPLEQVRMLLRLLLLLERLAAQDAPGREELEAITEELLFVVQRSREDDEWYGLAVLILGMALLVDARSTGSLSALRRGARYLSLAADHPGAPYYRRVLAVVRLPLLALTATLERDPDQIMTAVHEARAALPETELVVNERARTRWAIAMLLEAAHRLTREPARLDEAIAELEAGRAELAAGVDPETSRGLLWQLARSRGERAAAGGPGAAADRAAAIGTGLDCLRLTGEAVLLQLGAEHGLRTATDGAGDGLRVAAWAATRAGTGDGAADPAAGETRDVLEALELSRALVLKAAATSVGVPEQLAALGHAELAREWRRTVPDTGQRNEPLLSDPARVTEIPGTLRRRALDVLRGAPGPDGAPRPLLRVPDAAELLRGLRDSGADALAYLVPGPEPQHDGAGGDGFALVLDGGSGECTVLPLPGLSPAGRAPLARYLDASAARSALRRKRPAGGLDAREAAHAVRAVQAVQAAEMRWRSALEALCDWAGPAALAPLLDHVGRERGDAPGPPRLVLVPCGNLGVVPWHAARLPAGPAARAARRYAVQEAVLSYAASGAEFLRAAARGRMPLRSCPVLVTDPRLNLVRAEDEVLALHRLCYPDARVLGRFLDGPPPGIRVTGAGTPEELLAVLPGGAGPRASMVHVMSHGSAGTRPTLSALDLAPPDGGPGPADGARGPDPGGLTVSRLLDRPGGPASGEPGPLVVLSACETDLSTRDHDEALTLATAIVARGATDAVGSRWTALDGASALFMAVFHHFAARRSLAPPDALRAAQMWMLDPGRQAPDGLGGELLREAGRPYLADVVAWAAFIHQGSPCPAGPGVPAATDPAKGKAKGKETGKGKVRR